VVDGRYRIVRALAAGGMGEVYVATHLRLAGRFALKALHRDFLRDEDALSRFRGEAEIMAGLRHPNIVQVFDFGEMPDGAPFLLMELVEGRDLSEHLRDARALEPRRVGGIVRQIASALEAAHAHGVVHRDLKPENVMLLRLDGDEDFVKVVDFGVSKARWSHRITADTAIIGTPQFMAPEQAQGRREEIDHRTDQFALACIAYALLTGREPFRGENAVTILYQVVHQDPEPLANLVGWPCARVEEVLRRGMAKDPEARYPSALAFAHALDAAIHDDVGVAAVPAMVTAPAPPVERSDTARDRTLATVRMRPARPRPEPRMAFGLLGAAALALVVYTLETTVPWEHLGGRIGGRIGGAYHRAVDVTSRTVERFRPRVAAVR
jgi:serine/threonine-protein kinase